MSTNSLLFGIYGFEITRCIDVGPLRVHPRTSIFQDACNSARDGKHFQLTAIGVYNGGSFRDAHEFLFDFSAALTFCQQQWVAITGPFSGTTVEELMSRLPIQLDLPFFRPTRGALIQSDSFAPEARRNFLELCMSKLADKVFDQQTNLRSALFRNVESWKLQQSFIDLTYYLDFSALEILARTAENDFTTNVAAVASKYLMKIGFSVSQDNLTDRHLGLQTYAHLRNALFHNGEFETSINENGRPAILRLIDYEGYLRRLVPDVLLKVIGCNDPTIHWNRWIDRIPFQ